MKLYFTFASMPELQRLPDQERKNAYAELIHPILMEWRVRLAKFVFTMVVFFSAIFLGFMDNTRSFVVFFACYLVADHIFDLSAIRILRRKLIVVVSDRLDRVSADTASIP